MIRTPLLVASLLVLCISAPARAGETVTVRAVTPRAVFHPGDQFPIAVILDHTEGWHTWPHEPVIPPELEGLIPFATTIDAAVEAPPPSGVTAYFGSIQWPQAHPVVTGAASGRPVEILSYSGRAIAYVPVVIAPDAPPGDAVINLVVGYQACDDSVCLQDESVTLTVPITILERGAVAPDEPAAEAGVFDGFDPTVWSRLVVGADPTGPRPPPKSTTSRFDFFGYEFFLSSNSYALILLLAFAAGIIMNLTPCVLPVVPLKVMSLQQQARTPGKLAVFSAAYCLGIIAAFAVLGLLAFGVITGGRKFDWGEIFAYRWFSIAMAAIVGVMALGMMGLFTFRLPRAVYAINPSHDSLHGNFLFGVLTAILAVPCTGPLLGATLAWSGTQSASIGLATFLVMGAGMAFPYALLLAFPKWIDKLPRTGPGSELLKQVLGVLMLAVAVFLATNAIRVEGRAWIIGGIAVLAWVWTAVGGWRSLRTRAAKVRTGAFAFVMLAITVGATVLFARPGAVPWTEMANRPDSEIRAAIDAALAQGKTVVVDFTAAWCLNCHVIEDITLNSELGRKLLSAPDVTAIQVDLTSAGEDQGWGLVRQISGGGGIPLIAVYRPGGGPPTFFQSFFKPSDLERAMKG